MIDKEKLNKGDIVVIENLRNKNKSYTKILKNVVMLIEEFYGNNYVNNKLFERT